MEVGGERMKFKLSNETYDFLKDTAIIYMPAGITCFMTIGMIWNIPYTEPIGATLVALNTLLGACLKKSTNDYNKED